MDIVRVLQIVARRWLIVVPVCLVGVAATVVVAASIPPEYSATGSVIVVDQGSGTGPITASVLAEAVQDGETKAAIAAGGAGGDYQVAAGEEGILRVVATSEDEESAVATANAVLDRLDSTLQQRRAEIGVPGGGAGVEILSRPATATQAAFVGDFQAVGSARLLLSEEPAFSGDRASRLLGQVLAGDEVRQRIADSGGSAAYEIATSRDLPTVTVSATGTERAGVIDTVDAVMAAAEDELVALFALSGQDTSSVVAKPLNSPQEASADTRGIFRSVIALLALTAAVGIAVAFAMESLAEHRAEKRNRRLIADAPDHGTDSLAELEHGHRQRVDIGSGSGAGR